MKNIMNELLIYKKMSAIMADVEPIAKTRQNKMQGYQFRGIDEVYQAIQSVLVKHKVFTMPRVLNQVREERVNKNGGANIYSILDVEYKFYAEDGSFVEAIVVGEGMDNGDKASNKGMSVAHKYALLQAFCIPTSDSKDPENDSHEVELKNSQSENTSRSVYSDRYEGVTGKDTRNVTEAQLKRLYAITQRVGMPEDRIKAKLSEMGVKSSQYLNMKQYDELVNWIETGK